MLTRRPNRRTDQRVGIRFRYRLTSSSKGKKIALECKMMAERQRRRWLHRRRPRSAAPGHRQIRAIDITPVDHWYQHFDDVENLSLDRPEGRGCSRRAASPHTRPSGSRVSPAQLLRSTGPYPNASAGSGICMQSKCLADGRNQSFPEQ